VNEKDATLKLPDYDTFFANFVLEPEEGWLLVKSGYDLEGGTLSCAMEVAGENPYLAHMDEILKLEDPVMGNRTCPLVIREGFSA
jgi:hypothetical protein